MANAQQLFDYYGLAGDQAGVDWWQNQLNSGAMTQAQVRSGLVASPEYQSLASASTKPFYFGDHDNNASTMPTLMNNANSSIKFNHNVGGGTGVSQVYGDGFDSFNVGTRNGQPSYGGQQQNPFDMNQFMSGFQGMFKDALSGLGDMFNQNQQSSSTPENHWQTDYNQSSVLPPRYQTDMGGAKNGSGQGWGSNNPWNIKTF